MIRVTIELVPFGDETKKEPVGVLEISNALTGSSELGDYIYALEGKRWREVPPIHKGGRIKEWPRSKKNIWALVHAILSKHYSSA